MAMTFREGNQAKWIGARPAHNGTQIVKNANSNNAIAILHTVTAGKTFYLKGFALSWNASGSGNGAFLLVRDAADVLQYYLMISYSGAAGHGLCTRDYSQPIEIAAGFDICIQSNAATLSAFCTIDGWEE